jgi:hypothetical protein
MTNGGKVIEVVCQYHGEGVEENQETRKEFVFLESGDILDVSDLESLFGGSISLQGKNKEGREDKKEKKRKLM